MKNISREEKQDWICYKCSQKSGRYTVQNLLHCLWKIKPFYSVLAVSYGVLGAFFEFFLKTIIWWRLKAVGVQNGMKMAFFSISLIKLIFSSRNNRQTSFRPALIRRGRGWLNNDKQKISRMKCKKGLKRLEICLQTPFGKNWTKVITQVASAGD